MISIDQWHDRRTHRSKRPAYPASARMIRSRAKSNVAWAKTHLAPSRSWTLAVWTTQPSTSPSVSTSKCRLRPLTFFPRVVTTLSCLVRHLDTLAVEHADAWFGLPLVPAAHLLPESGVDASPSAVVPPAGIELVHRSPLGEVVRQHSPSTPGAGDVEDGVEDLSHVGRAWPTARFGGRNQRLDPLPLRIGQIGGVSLPCHDDGVN